MWQIWFLRVEIMFPLQIQICFILPYNQIIKTNNQIIKTNNQILKITVLRIRPRLTDVGSNYVGKWFKACNFALIGKHILTCLFLPKTMLVTQYTRVAHFMIVWLNSLKNWWKMNNKWWFLVRVSGWVPDKTRTLSLASNFFTSLKN